MLDRSSSTPGFLPLSPPAQSNRKLSRCRRAQNCLAAVASLSLVLFAFLNSTPLAVARSPKATQASLSDLTAQDHSQSTNSDIAPYEISAAYILQRDTGHGSLRVIAKLAENYHIYPIDPINQPGAMRTNILCASPNVQLGSFSHDAEPQTSTTVEGFEGQAIQWHEGQVIWTAPIELSPTPDGDSPNSERTWNPTDISITIEAQVCRDHCVPVRETIVAKFAGFYDLPSIAAAASQAESPVEKTYREADAMVQWSIRLAPAIAAPGQRVLLSLRGVPDAGFHLYEYAPSRRDVSSQTLIVLSELNGLAAGPPTTQQSPVTSDPSDPSIPKHYTGEVEFTIPLTIPLDQPLQSTTLKGSIGYHACSDEQCDLPRGLQFEVPIHLVSTQELAAHERTPQDAKHDLGASIRSTGYKQIADLPNRASWITEEASIAPVADSAITGSMSGRELLTTFSLAILGGLFLNFMPCVLPVIGLKVLGFVSEATGDRRIASKLTLVYSAGILAVILGLGVLSLTLREFTGRAYGWGEHFGMIEFRIASTAFMFALALSFLGVWEIPIPGFAVGGKAGELSRQNGYFGAFSKGVVTTLLATPCSAPFLGSALVVALTQPAWIVLVIFFGVGIGMAMPYLLISLQPGLLAFLPKPGPWMQTFKEFLAFPMLLAVVLFLYGFSNEHKIAMLASLVFLWFGCWVVGKVPAWASKATKLRAWSLAVGVTAIGSFAAFYWARPSTFELQWTPYSEERLQEYVSQGKPVLIDFTADWCLNCKQNLNTALHTAKVKDLVDSTGIVAMEADLTDYPAHIKRKLAELKSISIPLLAIYRPGDMQQPIVLRDRVTEDDVLAALHQVLPSASSESATMEVFESSVDPRVPMALSDR